MDIYAQNILDRYKKPFYKSLELGAWSLEQKQEGDSQLPANSSQLIRHKEANHSCGDAVEISLELEGDKVAKYSFSGAGCAISMAAADMLGDLILETTENEVLELTKDEIYEMLGIEISVRRSKCALLGLLALQNGILEHQKREKKSWKDYHI